MKNTIAQQLEEAIKTFEERLRNEAQGNSWAENVLRLNRARIPYKVIAPFMTKENLMQIARQKMSRRLLCGLSHGKLRPEDRFLFWEDVLSSVDILPVEWRAEMWLDCHRSRTNWTPRERDGRQPCYNCHDYDRMAVSGYVASSRWLVDAPLVRKWYCLLHKPGFELLSYIDQKRFISFDKSDKLLECIFQDDLPGFAMLYTMSAREANWTLVRTVLDNHACKIFDWLVENETSMFAAVRPYHLMTYAIANLVPEMAIHAIGCLERRFPGTVAQQDEFGNQLLWYCMYNRKIVWFEPDCEVVVFLCREGCRQNLRNHLGLSFEDICKALTPAEKRKMRKTIQGADPAGDLPV